MSFANLTREPDRETFGLMKGAGQEAATATAPRKLGTDEILEIERIGMDPIFLLKVQESKAVGVGAVAPRFEKSVG